MLSALGQILAGGRGGRGRPLVGRLLVAAAVRGGGMGLMLLTSVVLGRLLGAPGMGVYGFYTAALHTLGDLASLGLPHHVLRRVATLDSLGRGAAARPFVGRVLAMAVGLTQPQAPTGAQLVWGGVLPGA
ncbi:MAG: hypothetical protein ACFCBW_07355, partial [Candidatus Competibacterales bacterium]